MDDLDIVRLYFSRDEDAVNETEKKYGRLCFKMAYNILQSSEDAAECVNDTYFKLWNIIPPTYPDNFKAFICKITRNLALKRLEWQNAKKRSAVMVSLAELDEVLPDRRIKPETSDEEIGKLISTFLRQEKEEARNVFIRKYWFFDSISDIADRYSFSESKVKSMLFHTRNRLKRFLKKEGVEL